MIALLDQHNREQQLLTSLRSGDPKAVAQWYQEYEKKVRRYVSQRVTAEADVDEIVQEIFMNCLKHLPLFRGESGIWTWMCGVAKHEVSDFYRRKYAKKALQTLPLNELVQDLHVSNAHETSEVVVEHVAAVLNTLSVEAKEVLLLKYVDGKKVEEIAAEWRRSTKAVESVLFRARREFRAAYIQYGELNPSF